MRTAGQKYGLRGIRVVAHVLIPAAFRAIFSRLKIGWAFAWRTAVLTAVISIGLQVESVVFRDAEIRTVHK